MSSASTAGAGPSLSSQSKAAPSAPTEVDADLEKLLSREASAFQREVEVERILKAFKLNPYDMLDLDVGVTEEEVKKRYKKLSLFIHPDKTSHARAPEAFDLLKKAESELSDKAKRDELDAVIGQARALVAKDISGSHTSHLSKDWESSEEVKAIGGPKVWKERVRARTKELLIDEELRRRKALQLALANEGLEARKKDEEIASRKRKAEEDKAWEENREQRVDSWRSFTNNGGKKKKKTKGAALLG